VGPITLFDKSFLQSLSVDEGVWFDKFFMPVVCPVFYVETLADLAKEASKAGPAEAIVRRIADKFPELGGSPCGFHGDICLNDLLGFHTPMDGRIPRAGGRPVKTGMVFEQTPEEEAFGRWRDGMFHVIERIAATHWRKQLANLDLAAVAKEFRSLGIDGKRCRTLEEARDLAWAVVRGSDRIMDRLALAAVFLQIPQQHHARIVEAWKREGRQPLIRFAPYAAYVLCVEIFFQVALAAGLIATERPSNRTDIAYLFYLPFSTLFVSSDKLHRRVAKLFMRTTQEFVWGPDLKAALAKVNQHFLTFSEEERERGLFAPAPNPPMGNMVSELWDRHMRADYRKDREEKDRMTPEQQAEMLKRLKEFEKQPTVPAGDLEYAEAEMISIKRSVRRKRGSWWQVPKDMPDTQDE